MTYELIILYQFNIQAPKNFTYLSFLTIPTQTSQMQCRFDHLSEENTQLVLELESAKNIVQEDCDELRQNNKLLKEKTATMQQNIDKLLVNNTKTRHDNFKLQHKYNITRLGPVASQRTSLSSYNCRFLFPFASAPSSHPLLVRILS